jgi:hypothetical protein
MQRDHARGIAMLNAHLVANARSVRRLALCRNHGDALARAPAESMLLRHRVHYSEFCLALSAQREGLIESRSARLGKVDGSQNTNKLIHETTPTDEEDVNGLIEPSATAALEKSDAKEPADRFEEPTNDERNWQSDH